MPSPSEITNALTDWINRDLARGGRICAATDLLEAGLLDSLSIMELMQFVERRFRVHLEPQDISPFNFRTAERLAGLVAGKLQAPAAAGS